MSSKDLFRVTTKLPPLPAIEEASLLSLFDPQSADLNLFNLVDDELIRIAGSQIFYFKFHQSEDFDEVYLENRTKTIASQPIEVHGHYEPKAIEQNLTEFGLELTNDQVFIFNKSYITSRIGRPPIEGDVVKPKFQNMRFEIFEIQEDSFEIYGVYHIVCAARLLRDEREVVDEPYTKKTEAVGGYLDIDNV